MSTIETISKEVKDIAVQMGRTNQLTELMAKTQDRLVDAINDGNIKHEKTNGKILNIIENQSRQNLEMSSMRSDIKDIDKYIKSTEKTAIINKTVISAHWKMVVGAVSIFVSAFGIAYLVFVKNILV